MRRTGLLCLATLLVVPLLAAAPAAQPAVPLDRSAKLSDFIIFHPQVTDSMPTLLPPEQFGQESPDSSDGVCYKIRAYIFSQEDDHAPEFKGSTTCGPRQAQTKDVGWPKARLVPAK